MSSQTTVPEVTSGEVPAPIPQSIQNQVIAQPKNPFDSAMILSVSWKWPSLSRTISVDQIDVKNATPSTDLRKVRASKDLFDCQELKRLFGHAAKVDEFLNRRCLPFPLKRAVYLLPKDFFHEVEAFLSQHLQEREQLIEAAVNVYDAAVEQARIFLGPLFRANDYPPKETFKAAFHFQWQYLQIGVSEALREISAEIAQREADKMQATFVEASTAIQTLLRTSMNDLVVHLCDRLSPGEEGKRKVFRDSSIDNINEFLTTFRSRNLTEDAPLAALVEQAQQLVNGVSPAQLRENNGLRDNVQKGFAQIKEQLAALIQVAPTRTVRLVD